MAYTPSGEYWIPDHLWTINALTGEMSPGNQMPGISKIMVFLSDHVCRCLAALPLKEVFVDPCLRFY